MNIENGTKQMSYELRVNGRQLGIYEHPEDALGRVRTLMMCDCDSEAEVLDRPRVRGRSFPGVAGGTGEQDRILNRYVAPGHIRIQIRKPVAVRRRCI